ncbi:hypothetical protein [Methanolapillus millepedarum]|uniref:Uncharacterized protein n=1 Tax=Methanolapillus millepedarum TaxID=3028296 RepID=A0AA97A3L8_9EURY|nr:hypothetical protein MsAc7_06600 [Methanosarcinaceae archaeon Ac7]
MQIENSKQQVQSEPETAGAIWTENSRCNQNRKSQVQSELKTADAIGTGNRRCNRNVSVCVNPQNTNAKRLILRGGLLGSKLTVLKVFSDRREPFAKRTLAVNVTLPFENLKNKINTVYFFRYHLKMGAITRAHAARPKNRTRQTKIATEGSRSRSELFGNRLPPAL